MIDLTIKQLVAGKQALFRVCEDPEFDDVRAIVNAVFPDELEKHQELLQAIKDRQAIEKLHSAAADELERVRNMMKLVTGRDDWQRMTTEECEAHAAAPAKLLALQSWQESVLAEVGDASKVVDALTCLTEGALDYIGICDGNNTSAGAEAHATLAAAKLGGKMIEHLAAKLVNAQKDTQRLEFVVSEGAFLNASITDAGVTVYQLWNQDEDENFHTLSGDARFFPVYRDAIDAALAGQPDHIANAGKMVDAAKPRTLTHLERDVLDRALMASVEVVPAPKSGERSQCPICKCEWTANEPVACPVCQDKSDAKK